MLILSSTLSSITHPLPPPLPPPIPCGQACTFHFFNSLICSVCRPNSLSFNPYYTGNSFWEVTYTSCIIFQFAFSIQAYSKTFQSVKEWENTSNSDNFNLSLFQCRCDFNKLFVKISLGAGNSNSDTYLINSCLTKRRRVEEWWWREEWWSLKSDDETYGAVELDNQTKWHC